MMDSKLCPRCKEQRLVEWFGERKAPYAICLSCRVEVNGQRSTEKQEKRALQFRRNCAICDQVLLGPPAEICRQCAAGLQAFNNSPKLVGRASSYISGKLRRPKKQPKKFKVRNRQLQKLVQNQRADARDNYFRFEHAISKE